MLIAPAKVGGSYVIDPKVTLTKINMNSYYPKETFLACNPEFYKDKDKDIDIDIDMSDIVKATITKDGFLLNLSITQKDKSVITDCLTHIEHDIQTSQNTSADLLIEIKRNELQVQQVFKVHQAQQRVNLLRKMLKISEDFRQRLNEKQLKNLKTNELRSSTDLLYANIVLNNTSEIKNLMDQINKITTDLSSEQTRETGKVLPINIEKKSFPSLKLGLLLGLFLGGVFAFFISLVRNIKLENT